jgi:CTP synthase (UTP-ammonia lyase)
VIDYSNEVFTAIGNAVRAKYGNTIAIVGENVSQPAVLPCVAMDETYNVPSQLSSSDAEEYAAVTYRIQVFASGEGKRSKAREIFAVVAETCHSLNLMRKTYSPTPDVYNSSIYQISATFEADIRHDGMIFRR